jgi:signal transduction histidine kinase
MREHRHAEGTAQQIGTGAVAALRKALGPLDGDTGELLRGATHQLRTPLTSISGYVELLADGAAGPITEEQAQLLAAVARNAARLTALVDALEP